MSAKILSGSVHWMYSVIASMDEQKRKFNISRSSLRNRYRVNKYDIHVEGSVQHLRELQNEIGSKLQNSGYVPHQKTTGYFVRNVNGHELGFMMYYSGNDKSGYLCISPHYY